MSIEWNTTALSYNILHESREELVHKSAERLELSMDAINNAVIDELVMSLLQELPDLIDTNSVRRRVESTYYRDLKPYYDNIIRNKQTPRNVEFQISVKNNLNNKVFDATDRTMQTINQNRDWVKNAVKNIHDHPQSRLKTELLDEYKKLTGKNPVASRKNILDSAGKAIGSKYVGKNGKPFYYVKNPELSYRQVGRIAYNVKRGAIEETKYQRYQAINQNRIDEGRRPGYIAKEWIWSTLEKTRHAKMDGQVVGFEDKFQVINEVNGDIDYLDHPQDYKNAAHLSNVVNCGCTHTCLTMQMVADRGLSPYDFLDRTTGELLSNTNDHVPESEILKQRKKEGDNKTAIEILTVDPSDVQKAGKENIKPGKSNYVNSLSEKQIKYADELLGTKIPKESQISHWKYSLNSNITNDYCSLSEKEFLKKYKPHNLTIDDVKKDIDNFNKSSVVLKEDIIVYKGLSKKNPDIKRINDKNMFISTSLDESVAIGYTRGKGDYMTIKVPKGTRIIYLRKYSEYPNHMEIVIPPEYKIKEIKVGKEITYEFVKR
ncbi:MAG: ADP-ribosyltransferase [Methanobrevibacter sp.]|jgi:hypothetical protein|nr:ADP-ribosyltransferase [Candidatus Methanoflexus mossambicus]